MMVPANVINAEFVRKASSESGREKLAALGSNYIRDFLRETSAAAKILPMVSKTPGDPDIKRSVHHDTLVAMVEFEPESRAMSITFRGRPTSTYVEGKRMEVPFWVIASQIFEKTEQELMAYTIPVTQIIEKNTLKDLQEIIDKFFVDYSEAAVTAYGNAIESDSRTSALPGPADRYTWGNITKGYQKDGTTQYTFNYSIGGSYWSDFVNNRQIVKDDIVSLRETLSRRRLKLDKIFICEPDWDNLLRLDLSQFGDKLTSEIWVDGYKYNSLMGVKVVRTIKSDILRPGNIYGYTAPEFLGVSYQLGAPKFYIKKDFNLIQWMAMQTVAMAIGNIAAIAKVEAYPSAIGTADTGGDTGESYFASKPEEELGMTNLQTDGTGRIITSPSIVQY